MMRSRPLFLGICAACIPAIASLHCSSETTPCESPSSCAPLPSQDAGLDASEDASIDASTPNPDGGTCLCEDDGNLCTDDQCDENGICIHPPKAAGSVCRPSSGECDIDESCDGTDAACPKDAWDGACACPYHGPIAGYAEHDGLRAIPNSHFALSDTQTWPAYTAILDGLGVAYLSPDALDLNRTGTKPDAALASDLGSVVGYMGAFEWESGDQNVSYWIPQGLAGGSAGAKDFVVVSWHYDSANIADDPNPPVSGSDKGVRVSFADLGSIGGNVPYRHLLLVEPDAQSGFKSVNIHAGGMAWTGNYLYVADTSRGVRVFDISKLFAVSTSAACSSRVGANGNELCAYGYAYVLPQVGGYYFPMGLASACRPNFSFLSLDGTSTPPSLISGEYDNDPVNGIYSRLFRWPLDEATHKPAVGPGGSVRASGAWYAGNRNLQGATSIGGKFFLNATRYSGALFTGAQDQASKVYQASQGQWGWMPEGIYYEAKKDWLWINTEGHANMPRIVYAVKAGQIP